LKQRLINTWASISRNVIEEAVDQLKKRLHACVKAKGHQFEHLLLEPALFRATMSTNSLPGKHVMFFVISVAAIKEENKVIK